MIAADKFSPAKLIMLGTFGGGICNALIYAFSDNYIAMIIIWSLNAVVQFGIWPSVFKIVVSQLAPEHRFHGVFFINFTPSAGMVMSYATAAFITDWEFNFLLSTIILFSLVPIFFFCYRYVEKSMTVALKDPHGSDLKISGAPREEKVFHKILISGVPLLLLVYVVQGILNIGIKALVPVMLMENYDISPSLANGLNIILVLSGPVGLMLGALPIFKRFSYPTVIAFLFAISIPAVFVITFIGDLPVAVIIAALLVVSTFMSTTSIFFSQSSRVFEKFGCGGTLSGLYNCMSALGLVLANYGFTSIAENFGWGITTNVWLVVIISAFIIALITIPIWKRFINNI